MARSSHSAQDSRIEACRDGNECAGRTATATSVDRRQHFNSYWAPVDVPRISCLCRYFYVPCTALPVARGSEGRKKDYYSQTQKQRASGKGTEVMLHLFFSLLA
jgi:hypothetical protein